MVQSQGLVNICVPQGQGALRIVCVHVGHSAHRQYFVESDLNAPLPQQNTVFELNLHHVYRSATLNDWAVPVPPQVNWYTAHLLTDVLHHSRQRRDDKVGREPGERAAAGRGVPHDADRDSLPDELLDGRVEPDQKVPQARGRRRLVVKTYDGLDYFSLVHLERGGQTDGL